MIRRIKNEIDPNSVPFNIYPESNGIFPWGRTDNGDDLFWITEGKSDNWQIFVLSARDGEYSVLDLTVSEFLYKWMTNEIEISNFPYYEPWVPSFESYKPKEDTTT